MNNEVGQKVLAYRQAHGLTQTDMALLVGCTAPSISYWERGGGLLGVSRMAVECVMRLDDPVEALRAIRDEGKSALEQRINELEAENARLNESLNTIRVVLGFGADVS